MATPSRTLSWIAAVAMFALFVTQVAVILRGDDTGIAAYLLAACGAVGAVAGAVTAWRGHGQR